ncbi:MAG: serine/threonine protein kinase [Planctomycetes bacterium]|nr:serine/threonine protein kinase [Planctomycetota bacterium]
MSFAQPFSNYEILDRVGSGAMGTVFKARQKHLGRIVALKVLKPSLARDKRYVDRLRREARIVGRLNHPNVVTAYDLGEEGGYHFFVMEFVEGRSLRQLLAEWGMFPEDKVLDVATQITEALAHAFECGVIHRDVKPGNILIDDQGRVKLTDMGLAKAKTDLTLTRDGATVGTPQYISPEQARDPQAVDVRSDLYSLGATLFHMATGQPPFRAETIGELITKVLHDRPPSVTELNPELSDGLGLVIRKLLAKDPARRYQTPRELLDDLARVRRAERPAVQREELDALDRGATMVGPPRRRSRGRYVWGAAAVASVAVVGVLTLGGDGRAADAARRAEATATAVRALTAELGALPTARARLEHLAAARASAAVDDLAFVGAVDALRASVLEQLGQDLAARVDGYLTERRAETEAWLADPAVYTAVGGFEQAIVVPELRAQLGYGPDDLPSEALQSRARRLLANLTARLEPLLAARDGALAREHEQHLREVVAPRVELLIAGARFRAAELALERGIDAAVERLPGGTRAALPDALRDAWTERDRTFRDGTLSAIAGARLDIADALRREAQSELANLERLADEFEREAAAPDRLARALDRLEEGLRQRYPGADEFEPGASPWTPILPRIAVLRERQRILQDRVDEGLADEAIDLAHRVFADAGPAAAAEVLRAPAGSGGAAALRSNRHREWFLAVAGVVDLLVPAAGTLAVPTVVGPERAVLARGPDGRTQLVDAAGAPLPAWRDVAWDAVLDPSARPGPLADALRDDPRARLGVAFLALVADRPDAVTELLGDDDMAFARAEVWPRLERPTVAVEGGERAARAAFRDLLVAYDAERRDEVRRLLQEFELLHGRSAAARSGRELRRQIVSWLDASDDTGDQRLRLLAERAPEGFRCGVDEVARRLWCAAELGRAPGVSFDAGWERAGDALLHAGTGAATSLGILRVASPFALEQELTAVLEFRVPPRERDASVVWLTVHGGRVAVAILPSGAVVTAVPPRVDDGGERSSVAEAEDVRRAFDDALHAAVRGELPTVVDGAWHQLTVRVEPRRSGELRVRCWFDSIGEPLCDRVVPGVEREGAVAEVNVRTRFDVAFRRLRLETPLAD